MGGKYADVAGFCMSATLEDIKKHDFVLTPGRYVGAEDVDDSEEPFEERMARLRVELERQLAEAGKLDARIVANFGLLSHAE